MSFCRGSQHHTSESMVKYSFSWYPIIQKDEAVGDYESRYLIFQSMMELSHLGPILSNNWNCRAYFIEHHSAFTSKGSFQEPETLLMRIKQVR